MQMLRASAKAPNQIRSEAGRRRWWSPRGARAGRRLAPARRRISFKPAKKSSRGPVNPLLVALFAASPRPCRRPAGASG
jgi:hypothetical protein